MDSTSIYVDIFLRDLIEKFRTHNTKSLEIDLYGLSINGGDPRVGALLNSLAKENILIRSHAGDERSIRASYYHLKDADQKNRELTLSQISLPIYISLSAWSGLSLEELYIMQIVSKIIAQDTCLYKVIVLDLDDTCWPGTLSEDGLDTIRKNLQDSSVHRSLLHYIRCLVDTLGLFLAISTRNDEMVVRKALDKLDISLFPLKGAIDYVACDRGDKSQHLKKIAKALGVLPDSIVFIDNDSLIRDEVQRSLPEVFVPQWKNVEELHILLAVCGLFERAGISERDRRRKQDYHVIKGLKSRASLPSLSYNIREELTHEKAVELYKRSNQFNCSQRINDFEDGAQSYSVELFQDNGDSLGIASVFTVLHISGSLYIENWAVSCRFFEIGVEQAVLLYICKRLSQGKRVYICYRISDMNTKVRELIEKYEDLFSYRGEKGYLNIVTDPEALNSLVEDTNLELKE